MCFLREDGELGAAMACCENHERPYANIEDFFLSDKEPE